MGSSIPCSCLPVKGIDHLMSGPVHRMQQLPPKHAVWEVVGYIKGKRAVDLARAYAERKRTFVGQSFWTGLLRLDGGSG